MSVDSMYKEVIDVTSSLTNASVGLGATINVYAGTYISACSIWGSDTEIILYGSTTSHYYVTNGTGMVGSYAVPYTVNGGSAFSTVIKGGAMYIRENAVATDTTIYSGGTQCILLQGSAAGTLLHDGAQLYIDEGWATGTTVESGGMVVIDGAGYLDVTQSSGGNIKVAVGNEFDIVVEGINDNGAFGIASDYTFWTNNSAQVTVASNFIIYDGGEQLVFDDGLGMNTEIHSGGSQVINAGGLAWDANILSGGLQVVNDGGSATGTAASGSVIVNNGGFFASAAVTDTGDMTVKNGGSADEIVIISGASGIVENGGKITSSYIYEASLEVEEGGSAFNMMRISGAALSVEVGADDTACRNGGVVEGSHGYLAESGFVSTGSFTLSNGVASGFVLESGAVMTMKNGGVALDTKLGADGTLAGFTNRSDNGFVTAMSGAEVTGTASNLDFAGVMNVADGGEVTLTTIASDGVLKLAGNASGTTLNVMSGAQVADIYNQVDNAKINGITGDKITDTANGVVFSGTMNVADGGVVEASEILATGVMNIASGGAAVSTQVDSGAMLKVFQGGSAASTDVSGTLAVLDGGKAVNVIQASDGLIDVDVVAGNDAVVNGTNGDGGAFSFQQGVADGFLFYANQVQRVSNGGVAKATTLSAGATQEVGNGGFADGTTIAFDAAQNVYSNAIANNAVVNGLQNVKSGAFVNNATVNAEGIQVVYNGGFAALTTVANGGFVFASSGATVTGIIQQAGGNIGVVVTGGDSATRIDGTNADGSEFTLLNGVASNFIVFDNGLVRAANGGVTIDTQLRGGALIALAGGSAIGTVIKAGTAYVEDNGIASDTVVNADGTLLISQGGYATGVDLMAGGRLDVASNAMAANVNQQDGGLIITEIVSGNAVQITGSNTLGEFSISNGVASNVVVYNGGVESIGYVGRTYSTTVKAGGSQVVNSTGIAYNTQLESGASQIVSNGGLVSAAVISAGAVQTLNSGAKTYYNQILSAASQIVATGAKASATTVSGGGRQTVDAGGIATGTNLESGAVQSVYFNGSAIATTVSGGASQIITIGGIALETTVLTGGSMVMSAASIATDTTLFGGTLITNYGATLHGTTAISGNWTVNGLTNIDGELVFDLFAETPGTTPIIDNFFNVATQADISISVSDTQASGDYTLAGNAALFNPEEVISVIAEGHDKSEIIGALVLGESFRAYGKSYSLDLSGTDLVFNVTTIETAADLNSDGLADVLMSHDAGYTYAWLTGRDGETGSELSDLGDGWELFGTGSYDGALDDSDIYIYNDDANVVGVWQVAAGKVTNYETVASFDEATSVLAIGDYNGDGMSDLLLRNDNGTVGAFITDGSGWKEFGGLGDEWELVATGDFNGDGVDDVTIYNTLSGDAGNWLVKSDGSLEWASLDKTGAFSIIGSGDFNADGIDDVLLYDRATGVTGAWSMNSSGSIESWMTLGTLNSDTKIEVVADYNGDGVDDLRVRTSDGVIGAMLVGGESNLTWKQLGEDGLGSEWKTSLASLS